MLVHELALELSKAHFRRAVVFGDQRERVHCAVREKPFAQVHQHVAGPG